jgi:hypothetical protein
MFPGPVADATLASDARPHERAGERPFHPRLEWRTDPRIENPAELSARWRSMPPRWEINAGANCAAGRRRRRLSAAQFAPLAVRGEWNAQ